MAHIGSERLTDSPASMGTGSMADEEARDAIAWRAARIILMRLVAEPSYGELDPGLRLTIERFLERHPALSPSDQ